jgi:hypothetical protein
VYIFDGSTSHKLTNKISDTLLAYNTANFGQCVATVNRRKNMVYMAFPTSSTNNIMLVWNFYLNAWSLYKGLNASAMTTAYVGGKDERPLFSDYSGFTYRMDTGTDDYPLNTKTAIDAYYYTNWKAFDDLINKKGVPEVTLYYTLSSALNTFSYSYDFNAGDQFSNTFSTTSPGMLWGVGVWGVDLWGGTGGGVIRRDLTGRGRVVRFKIANSTLSETFRIDAIGAYVQLDTNV